MLPVESYQEIALSDDEATDYVRDCGLAWRHTPGVVVWLDQLVRLAKKAARAELPADPR